MTLDQVSASTKISVGLLDALERDDLSHWPKGLYRRAFFRAYVTALGLPPDPLALEFARLFPDEPSSEPPPADFAVPIQHASSQNDRLALASVEAAAASPRWRSLLIALVEMAAVVAAGSLVAWTTGTTLLTGCGAVALVYYPAMRAAAGQIRGSSILTRRPTAAAEPTGAIPTTSRAATMGDPLIQAWSPRAVHIAKQANVALRRGTAATAHALRHGVEATGRASRRVINWTTPVLLRVGTATGRALMHAATEMGRLSSRAFGAANHTFWRGVRATAEYAQLLAARQLNRTTE